MPLLLLGRGVVTRGGLEVSRAVPLPCQPPVGYCVMTLRRTLTLTTHADAARADREANWAKTPQERLAEVEFLRAQRYPGGVAPRMMRVIEFMQGGPER